MMFSINYQKNKCQKPLMAESALRPGKKMTSIVLMIICMALFWTAPGFSKTGTPLHFKPLAFDLDATQKDLQKLMADWGETAFTPDDELVRHVSYFLKYYAVLDAKRSNKAILRSEKYLQKIKHNFRNYKIPEDVAFALPFVESLFNSGAQSSAGAVGMFQFLEGTAVHYGLKVNQSIDERKNYKKASQACAKYLRDNRRVFASTVLSLASYHHGTQMVTDVLLNCGEDTQRKFKSIFYNNKLGPFSREYIPQNLAAALIYRYLRHNRLKALPVPETVSRTIGTLTQLKSLKTRIPGLLKMNPDLAHAETIYPYVSTNGYLVLTKLQYTKPSAGLVRTYPDWAKNPAFVQKPNSQKIKGLSQTIQYTIQTHNDLPGIAAIFGTSVKALKFGNRELVTQGLHAADTIVIKGMSPTTQVLGDKCTVCGHSVDLKTIENETLKTFCNRVKKTILAACKENQWEMGEDLSPELIYYWNHDTLGYITPDTPMEGGLILKIYSDYRWQKIPSANADRQGFTQTKIKNNP